MKKVKLVDVAQDAIRQMILNGEYDENGYLPSEGELTVKLEMSRATVREAVRSMEVRGFLKRIHGKGLQVRDNSLNVMSRSLSDMLIKGENVLEDLLEIRSILEPKAASLAAERHKPEDLVVLEKHVAFMESAKTMDGAYYEADLAFHTDLAKISGNRLIESFIYAYSAVLKDLIIESSHADEPLEQRFHYHRNVLAAVKSKDAEAADCAMKEHVNATYQNRDNSYIDLAGIGV